MFHVVLVHPEIPPNTGNILRLCANTGCTLHLVKPLGFRLSDRALKRAGLDYGEIDAVNVHSDWQTCSTHLSAHAGRVFAVSTRGSTRYDQPGFAAGDAFVFGSETAGLPASVLGAIPETSRLRLPMLPRSRSLNLSNAVAVVVYEAWRQNGFGAAGAPASATADG
jgi:tRNA (cytidine/uridine-2'-O-)-methyltransferase